MANWRHNWLHDVIVKWRYVFLVKFSYWPKFHVNIITGFRVQKRFDWKSGNRKYTPVWVFLWWVRDTKFAMNVSNEMLGNAVKCQACSFYRFWVIKGKPTRGGEVKISPTQIRAKFYKWSAAFQSLCTIFVLAWRSYRWLWANQWWLDKCKAKFEKEISMSERGIFNKQWRSCRSIILIDCLFIVNEPQ